MQLVFEILEHLLYHKANEINLCFLLFTSNCIFDRHFIWNRIFDTITNKCQQKKLLKFADKFRYFKMRKVIFQ